MLKQVILADNPLDVQTYKRYDVDNIFDFIMSKYNDWPETARLYHGNVSLDCDITPTCEDDIKRIQEMSGPFFVIVYPGETVLTVFSFGLLSLVSIAVASLLRPSIPNSAQRNGENDSPNNGLSNRTNEARLHSRIPDIYGTVRSTPDLIAVPYRVFIKNQEVEYAYMCIGRGEYEVSDIRDDSTPCAEIEGTSVEVYAPYSSPNSSFSSEAITVDKVIDLPRMGFVGQIAYVVNDGANNGEYEASIISLHTSWVKIGETVPASSTQLTIGTPINTPLLSVSRSNSINGQVLRAPNDAYFVGNLNVVIVTPNLVECTAIDFTTKFNAGDLLTISGSGSGSANYDGTFTIASVTASAIALVTPWLVNTNWGTLTGFTPLISPTLLSNMTRWLGPFVMDYSNTDRILANFVALGGLYLDDGTNQLAINIGVELEVTPLNADGTARGAAVTFSGVLEGSAVDRQSKALTIKATLPFTGKCSVRARRLTATFSGTPYKGQVVDEVKLRDLYAASQIQQDHFGNVTTVHSVTRATASALAVKDRKLNMLVTRKLPYYISGSTFSTELMPTNYAADIICAICLDKFIGNRNVSELDAQNIYGTIGAVMEYFGTADAAQFNYTFGKDNISFEETISTIAQAVFCTAYRRGSQIKLSFEGLTEDSTLLFNHRNKLPGSETRTVTFGNDNDNDGVEYTYVDPKDDAIVTMYLPEDRSAINPVKIESVGVRSGLAAWFHAWRAWNKIRFQNITVEFEATQEASVLVLKDRILVADNTRPDTQDGEIVSQNVLILTLSQQVELTKYAAYAIFLQHIDGTVETIPISAGATPFEVVLAYPPRQALALDFDLYARTTFIIVGNEETSQRPFLVVEKSSQNNFTSVVKAVNYSDKYYTNDTDFSNNVVNSHGERL